MPRRMLLLIGFLIFSQYVHAGIIVGGTRLIYNADKKEASLSVKNPDPTDYLVQAWIDHGDKESTERVPFAITPPLQRLNAGEESLLRIINTTPLPQDRESQFWLSVKSIAAIDEAMQNRLQITIRTRIKLFYRPASLKEGATKAFHKLKFTRQGNQLQVNNPTPYFITLQNVKVGGRDVKEPGMVAPFGTLLLDIPKDASGAITWQAINDYGSATETARQ